SFFLTYHLLLCLMTVTSLIVFVVWGLRFPSVTIAQSPGDWHCLKVTLSSVTLTGIDHSTVSDPSTWELLSIMSSRLSEISSVVGLVARLANRLAFSRVTSGSRPTSSRKSSYSAYLSRAAV